MDILISSNLERLLYFVSDAEQTAAYMAQLNQEGRYTVSQDIKQKIDDTFVGYCANEEQTAQTLKNFYQAYGYLADTHTSVALHCAEQYRKDTADQKKMIVASTASPYKFAADVYRSITEKEASADTGALQDLSALTNTDITPPLCGLSEKPVRFDRTIDPAEMLEEVYRFM